MKKTMGKKFNRLERKVEREYEEKGVSHKTAAEWARATAGKVYREKEAKMQCGNCGSTNVEATMTHNVCHNCGNRVSRY